MSFKREWAIGAWANRASLTYTDIDKSIHYQGKDLYCDSFGRMVINKETGRPRPVYILDDQTTTGVWYITFTTDALQAVIKVTIA